MTSLPRRTLSEICTLYTLEPALNDIYVEGGYDQDLINHYFSSEGYLNKKAYSIEGVDISSEVLVKHGLTEGNKQRVIAKPIIIYTI